MELVSQAGEAEEGISRELIKGMRLTSWRTQGRQGRLAGNTRPGRPVKTGFA